MICLKKNTEFKKTKHLHYITLLDWCGHNPLRFSEVEALISECIMMCIPKSSNHGPQVPIVLRSVQEPDADQSRCRICCLFKAKVKSQDIRYARYRTAGKE